MLLHSGLKAQVPDERFGQQGQGYQHDRNGNPLKKDTTGEELKHRDKYEDSITISYH